MIWQIVGVSAAGIMVMNQVPQIIKGFRRKKLDDLSMGMLACISVGLYFWMLYGYHLRDPIIIFANFIGVMINLFLIFLKKYYELTET